ncbi:AAA family ATPase [Corynebacterium glyciniphilum]|uniref:AAA family ATPase n=1 Tax=Corynebacterium glyciniphilum TaxID=1404244 RepID=UPI0016433DA7|nr:AAA family ATPase [Corynebacterium glyciniphilum]
MSDQILDPATRRMFNEQWSKGEFDDHLGKLGLKQETKDGDRRVLVDKAGNTRAEQVDELPGTYRFIHDTRVTTVRRTKSVNKHDTIDAVGAVALYNGATEADTVAASLDGERQRTQRKRSKTVTEKLKRLRDDDEAKQLRNAEKLAAQYEEAGRRPGDSWGARDDDSELVAAVFAGEVEQPTPSVMARVDGAAMFYPGKTHSVYGEPGSGKSWLVLAAAAEQIAAGRHVLYLDYEDGRQTAYNRLRLLGANGDDVVRYFHHREPDEHPSTPKAGETSAVVLGIHKAFDAMLVEHDYSLVVLDGVTNALSLAGFNGNDNGEATMWNREVPRYIADHTDDAVVVMVDHLAKSRQGSSPGRYAIGAQSKLGDITGAAFRVDVVEDPAAVAHARLDVSVTKDRHGGVFAHSAYIDHGHLFGQFSVTTDTSGAEGQFVAALVGPDGAAKWHSAQTARRLADTQPGVMDRIVSEKGVGLTNPVLVAVAIAHLGGEDGVTRAELEQQLKVIAPATYAPWKRGGHLKTYLDRAKKSGQVVWASGNHKRLRSDRDALPGDAVAVLDALRAVGEIDQPGELFGPLE